MSALTERTVGTHIISWRNWGTLLSNKRCGGHILSLKDLEPQVEGGGGIISVILGRVSQSELKA